jgi:hypothetical protein
MTCAGTTARWHGTLRIAIFALLCCNTAYYLYAGPPSKALDAGAWLTLLALYALETGSAAPARAPRAAAVMRAFRLLAAIAVCAAGAAYIVERNTLDAINTALWIGVVILLELEVRRPHAVARRKAWFAATAVLLYAGLGVLVLAWAWRAEWFDAYDALLWLSAFATIEMDVLRTPRAEAGP